MIPCAKCGEAIAIEKRFWVFNGKAYHEGCMTHTTSQAGELQGGDGCLRPAEQEQENG
jgi:hypothetical protein